MTSPPDRQTDRDRKRERGEREREREGDRQTDRQTDLYTIFFDFSARAIFSRLESFCVDMFGVLKSMGCSLSLASPPDRQR